MGGQGRSAQPDGEGAGQAVPQERVRVGTVAGVHGLKGELKVDLSSAIAEDFVDGLVVWLTWRDRPEAQHEVQGARVVTAGTRKGIPRILLKLVGIDDRDAAETLREAWVWAQRADLQRSEGEFFLDEVIGFDAVRPDGSAIGRVTRIEAGGQGRLVIETDGREVEIPAVPPIIVEVHFDAREIVLEPPPGLLEGEEA